MSVPDKVKLTYSLLQQLKLLFESVSEYVTVTE